MLAASFFKAAATAVNGFKFVQTISADTNDYNLRSAAIAAGGWDQVTPLLATITINPGIVLSASSASSYGFNSGALPTGSQITIVNNGYVCGMGGAGGDSYPLTPGLPGNPALITSSPTFITNNGTIAGGGGGGGSGSTNSGGSGGRTGRVNSPGGDGSNGNGRPGSFAKGGDGGYNAPGGTTGPGGDSPQYGAGGGGWGAKGGAGFSTSTGGAGGAAVVGNSYITWAVTGLIYGALT